MYVSTLTDSMRRFNGAILGYSEQISLTTPVWPISSQYFLFMSPEKIRKLRKDQKGCFMGYGRKTLERNGLTSECCQKQAIKTLGQWHLTLF